MITRSKKKMNAAFANKDWTQKDLNIFAFKIQVAAAKGMVRRLKPNYWGRWLLLASMELI